MLKDFQFEQEALYHLAQGIINACLPIKETYGPYGKDVLIVSDQKKMLLTKSSAAVMQNYSDPNLFSDEGAKLVREAILNTAEYAGDGTTLTAILVEAMVKRAKTYLTAGHSFCELQNGLKAILAEVIQLLEANKIPCDKSEHWKQMLVFHFGNTREIKLLMQAMEEVGTHGFIQFEAAYGHESYRKTLQGMKVMCDVITDESFENKANKQIELLHPILFVCDELISDFSMLLPVITYANEEHRSLCIIAKDIAGEAKKMLEVNIQKKVITAVAIKTKGFGRSQLDLLEDICAYTNATLALKQKGFDFLNLQEHVFGESQKITITGNQVIIQQAKDLCMERFEAHMLHIKKQKEAFAMNAYDKERYDDRMRRLNGRVCIIFVGAMTLATEKEEIRKLQSALRMIRKSIEEGAIIGGGSGLFHASNQLLEQIEQDSFTQSKESKAYICGEKLLLYALLEPIKILCNSGGIDGLLILEEMKHRNAQMGYDIVKQEICDFKENGMMDSLYVIKTAMQQSVSIVYEWLSTAVLMVSTKPDREDIALMKQGVPIMR